MSRRAESLTIDRPIAAAGVARRLHARLRPLWGEDGRGMLWLAVGVGSTFALGLLLQLVALRALAPSGYSLLVVSLGIGNVAAAIAAAVQPVVALHTGDARANFLPASPRMLVAAAAVLVGGGSAVLAPSLGPAAAALALAQIPLHATVAVGLGRLQQRRAFAPLAACLALWSITRVAVVVPLLLLGHGSSLLFVTALPVALALELLLLAGLGAFRGISWQPSANARALLMMYGLWALLGWLLNADVLYARLFASSAGASAYAIAFTIGRQPLYAAAPLTMVLLSVTAAGQPREQRARLWAVLGAAALLLVGTLFTIGVAPGLFLQVLAGRSGAGLANLVRGYGVVGSLGAALMLLATFVFALGMPPRLRVPVLIAIASLAAAPLVARGTWSLLFAQGLTIAALVIFYARAGLQATRSSGTSGSIPSTR